jgi:hypothetical protein
MAAGVRFVHCGGFQFDSPSWEGPEEWTLQRKQDLWQTFEAVLALCRSEKVDCLLLTGNLFEQDYVRKETVDRVVKALGNLEKTRIFITPGERDPLVSTSAYRLGLWPQNVHIFPKGMSSVKIPALNLTIYGAGWTAYRQEIPFLDGFRSVQDGTHQLMLLHAVVGSGENLDRFSPLSPADIAASGLDYLALGHQEVWGGIQQSGRTFWGDSGLPEARSFRENGPHGVVIGEISNEKFPELEFRPLGQRCYVEKVFSVQSQTEVEELAAKLLAESSESERQTNLFRIKLSGATPVMEAVAEADSLRRLLADKFKYLEIVPLKADRLAKISGVIPDTEVQTKIRLGEGFPTIQQILSNHLQEKMDVAENDDELEHWELVQKIGLAAFEQGRVDDED